MAPFPVKHESKCSGKPKRGCRRKQIELIPYQWILSHVLIAYTREIWLLSELIKLLSLKEWDRHVEILAPCLLFIPQYSNSLQPFFVKVKKCYFLFFRWCYSVDWPLQCCIVCSLSRFTFFWAFMLLFSLSQCFTHFEDVRISFLLKLLNTHSHKKNSGIYKSGNRERSFQILSLSQYIILAYIHSNQFFNSNFVIKV